MKFFFLTVGGLSLVISSVFYFLAPTIANDVYQKPQITQVLQVLAFALPPMSIIYLMSAVLKGFQQIKYSVILSDIVLPILSGLFFSAAWYFGKSLITVMYLIVAINILGAMLASYFLLKIFPQIMDKSVKAVAKNKEIFLYSLPMFMSVFLNIFLSRTDVLMLGYFGSTADVGIYSIAAKLSQIVFIIASSFYAIFSPLASELFAKNDRKNLKMMFSQATRISIILTIPIFIALLLGGRLLLSIFGESFSEGSEVLMILGLAFLINSILGFAGQLLGMSGRSKLALFNSLSGAGLNITLNWYFIPIWGMAGAAWATMISTVLVNVLRVSELYYLEKMHALSLGLLKPIIIGGVLLAGILILKPGQNIFEDIAYSDIANVAIFGVTYMVLTIYFVLIDKDREMIGNVVNKLRGKSQYTN